MEYQFSFERLRVWEDVMNLTKQVYQVSVDFPKEELYGLTSQIRRAIVSVSSNLAEGGGRLSGKEQARFTEIAYSSLMEVLSQLLVAKQLGYLSEEKTTEFRKQILPIANQLNALRDSQKNRIAEPEVPYETMNRWQHFTDDNPTALAAPDQPFNLSTFQPFNLSTLQPFNLSTLQPSDYYVHPSTIIDPGAQIGNNTKIWHCCHIMPQAVIGDNCSLGQNVFVANGVTLGNNVKVQNNVSIYEGVTCEDDVFLGPSMVFTNVINPRSAVNRKSEYLKTTVGKGATIGANATIVCGNDIGKYAFIGAGAVVTKAVPAYALVVGNPARQIGWMSEHGEKLEFDKKGDALCDNSGEKYQLVEYQVTKIG